MEGWMNKKKFFHDRINRNIRDHDVVDISACGIFKVPNPLREINKEAYEPQVISIGPYHHGKEHLKAMEVQKMNSLKLFLDRTGENGVEKYVAALEEMEEEVCKFYSEPLDHIRGIELAEMMLLDGFFIIELIFQSTTSFLTDFHLGKVMRDLLLIENQLPFFVLSKLYSLSSCLPLNTAKDHMADEAVSFFGGIMPASPIKKLTQNQDARHLLGLLHDLSYSSEEVKGVVSSPLASPPPCSTLAVPASSPGRRNLPKLEFINSATKLSKAGIKFQRSEGKLFEIKFQMGVMTIPTLQIHDNTESILRNLVAYEQCSNGISSKCFTSYLTLMHCLINTGKDVELLCHHRILENWLGDPEVLATMIHGFHDSLLTPEADFLYAEIFRDVNVYCNIPWNSWKANIWHFYFNTPGALISFSAAVLLLLCTLLQTLFSILSYHGQSV